MIKPHWSIHYLYSKLVYTLHKKLGYDKAPWIVIQAIVFLKKRITANSLIFEWGSGNSSIWYAERARYITAIEHNPLWFETVDKIIRSKKISNIQLVLKNNDENYENYIDNYCDEYFDIIVVDGIRRLPCLLKAFNKLKKGGVLVLDNAERYLPSNSESPNAFRDWKDSKDQNWIPVEDTLKEYKMFWYSNGVFDTAIFIKY